MVHMSHPISNCIPYFPSVYDLCDRLRSRSVYIFFQNSVDEFYCRATQEPRTVLCLKGKLKTSSMGGSNTQPWNSEPDALPSALQTLVSLEWIIPFETKALWVL